MINLIDFFDLCWPFLTDLNILDVIFNLLIGILIGIYSKTDKFKWALVDGYNSHFLRIALSNQIFFSESKWGWGRGWPDWGSSRLFWLVQDCQEERKETFLQMQTRTNGTSWSSGHWRSWQFFHPGANPTSQFKPWAGLK